LGHQFTLVIIFEKDPADLVETSNSDYLKLGSPITKDLNRFVMMHQL
jgi:hypothetical protein